VPSDAAERSRTPRWGLVAAAIVVGVVVVDQLTKAWAVDRLAGGPVEIIGTTVSFELRRNSGGAFSLFQGFTPLLAVLAVVLSGVLVWAVLRADDPLVVVAFALVLGGSLGNLVDRVARDPSFLRGEVVDFVKIGGFPVFNVADSSITVGAVLLAIAALRPTRQPA
jgi:signal peptidase II